ncbi:MAG: phosphoribosylaminoimidazolesuccinocarboxamide synthase [Pirellulaceae bacterium]
MGRIIAGESVESRVVGWLTWAGDWRAIASTTYVRRDRIMEGMRAILETHLPFPKRQGKVRDVYDLGDRLLIVSTDRISAFDWILPTPIPDKGRLLTQLSLFWFEQLGEANHLLDQALPDEVRRCDPEGDLEGRSMVVR